MKQVKKAVISQAAVSRFTVGMQTLGHSLLHPVLAFAVSLLIGAVIIMLTGENPLEIYGVMLHGAFGGKYYISSTLTRATPIIITGLGAAIAWSSNYMGIGGEGQMIWGGFIATIVSLHLGGPIWLVFTVAILCAVAAGGLYSLFSAWLLDKLKMSLAISTLMMNYIAQFVTFHFVSNVFLDTSGTARSVRTYGIDERLFFAKILPGYSLHSGFILAVILVLGLWFFMNRTNRGYEFRMSGFNLNFCDYGGINSRRTMYLVLFLSGALCAFAGVVEVYGVQHKYLHGMFVTTQFAWLGLNAALISGYNPIGVFFTSIVLAGISTGGAAIDRSTDVPLEISAIIQGCITLFISAKIVIEIRRKRKQAAEPGTRGPGSGNGETTLSDNASVQQEVL